MRKTILTTVCAAAFGLSGLAAASAQNAAAPASNQTKVTSPHATDKGSMNAMNKMKKKSSAKHDMKSDMKTDTGGTEKK